MSAKPTPGPWRVAEVDGEPGLVEIRAGLFPAYLGTVASVYDLNEKHANARLIAAAPDLLDALRGLIEQAKAFEMPEHNVALSAALAAIAKAESGQ